MDVLTRRIDRVEEQIGTLSGKIEILTESQRLAIETQTILSENNNKLTNISEQIAAKISSTSAVVERMDRILDYLVRRDR